MSLASQGKITTALYAHCEGGFTFSRQATICYLHLNYHMGDFLVKLVVRCYCCEIANYYYLFCVVPFVLLVLFFCVVFPCRTSMLCIPRYMRIYFRLLGIVGLGLIYTLLQRKFSLQILIAYIWFLYAL